VGQVILEQAIHHLLVVVVDQNGNVYSIVHAKITKVAASRVECVLAQAAGVAKIITKVVKIGGHGDSNMDHHGVQQFAQILDTHNQALILNSIRGMTFTICKVVDQLVEI
jgi:hypothetical protein